MKIKEPVYAFDENDDIVEMNTTKKDKVVENEDMENR